MQQFWHIYNIDARQANCEGGEELGDFFFLTLSDLDCVLRLPILPKEVDKWLDRGKKVMQPGPFGKLSVELIDQIYEELSDETTHVTVSLAITCKHLLEDGKRHILRSLRKFHSPWVGERLICLGEHTGDNDLPKGMLTDAELKEAQETEVDWIPREDMNFSNFAIAKYKMTNHFCTLRCLQIIECHDATHTMRSKADNLRTPLECLEVAMLTLLCCQNVPSYPSTLVLCNMTKAEYVREDKMSEMVLDWGQWGPNKVNLAHALLSRICWSSDYSVSMVCEEEHLGKLCRGPWVGDRFCITAPDTMPSPGLKREWRDVTAEVDEFLMYLCKINEKLEQV